MSTLFNQTAQNQESFGINAFGRSGMSPSKKGQDPFDGFQDPFSQSIEFPNNNLFGHPNEVLWENLQPSNLSRGPSNFEMPVSKKLKIDHKAETLKSQQLQGYIMPSSTQSDTSNYLNSSSSNSFQISRGGAFNSRSDESSHNTTSNYDQSVCSDSHNITDQNLTKKNKRDLKNESKICSKRKESSKKEERKQPEKNSKENSKNKKKDSTNDSSLDYQKLTNKKKEYLQEIIADKNGLFNYEEDPNEYKRARKRMQNRESAVRSRLRKRYYQDELEDKIAELEKIQKEISEQNAGLSAQNTLLKKQLAYFEDVFAKSSLLGFDQPTQNINRSDLEEFQKSLLRKINHSLYQDRELEMIPESSLEIIPGSSNNLSNQIDDVDNISTNSLSNENRLESLRLIRSRSNSSSFSHTGYLFLCIVFCMMCCSSFIVSPQNVIKLATQTQSQFSKMIVFEGGRKMMSASKDHSKQYTLADQVDQDVDMLDETRDDEEPLIGAVSIVKMLLSGQYTYLTYMLLSTTCFFFWLMPNCHKIRSLFSPMRKANIPQKRKMIHYKNAQIQERQIQTRSASKQYK